MKDRYLIRASEALTEERLNRVYEELVEGGDLYIVRSGRHIHYEREGILLIKCGFINIVESRNTKGEIPELEKGSYLVHCKKGKKYTQLLSIIVPLFNEEATAELLLRKLVDHKWTMPVEIVIVESNSADKTRDIAKAFEDLPNVKLILEDGPRGKGNAVLMGIKEASGNYIAIQDGDLEYDVEDYDKLLKPIIDLETLFVLGSRYNKDDWHMRKFKGKKAWIADYLNLGQTSLTWLLNTACGCKLTDPFTMYKIFHRDCMYGINFVGGNFGLDWELVIRFIRKGYHPVEIPISYKARSYEEGKHIDLLRTPIEGIKALWHCRYASKVYDYGDE
ncbi:MAG: glycosyltransferase family 2 protein [Lachnospiraceae bacterium]|nr:glycosyltransferase family 2 protein [Lachnospiraceae bacterium]